jgi:hypothetical protein
MNEEQIKEKIIILKSEILEYEELIMMNREEIYAWHELLFEIQDLRFACL